MCMHDTTEHSTIQDITRIDLVLCLISTLVNLYHVQPRLHVQRSSSNATNGVRPMKNDVNQDSIVFWGLGDGETSQARIHEPKDKDKEVTTIADCDLGRLPQGLRHRRAGLTDSEKSNERGICRSG